MTLVYQPAGRIPASHYAGEVDDDVEYWKYMKQLAVFQEPGQVTSVDFSPNGGLKVASTSSVRLSLFDSVLCEPSNLYSRFKKAVHGARFRHDGRLIVIGGDEGKIRVFNVDYETGLGKAPLRSMKVSENAVHVGDFSIDSKSVISMADDGIIKVWDIAETNSKPVVEFSAHKDFIKAGRVSKLNTNLIVSGGYDHQTKVWDIRQAASEGAVLTIDAAAPIEDLVFLPNESLIVVAAANSAKVIDITAGGRILQTLQNHHKTITSLCVSNKTSSLLTAGIDKRINVHSLTNFGLTFSTSVASPVFSLALSEDNDRMAIGMGNLLAIHAKATVTKKEPVVAAEHKETNFFQTNVKVNMKGEEKKKVPMLAPQTKQVVLDKVDKLLKAYRHGDAIRIMFSRGFYVREWYEQVMGWLQVLLHRGAIHAALAGQTTAVQQAILKFLQRFMFKNNYFRILSVVAVAFFEVYSKEDIEPEIVVLLKKLNDAVTKELSIQCSLTQTIGSLELIISNSRTVDKRAPTKEPLIDLFGEPVFTHI